MKMTFIGSGSAFTLDNYQSNILIDSGASKLLIDCGGDARFALRDLGYSYRDIDNVYISHLHADHIGGLEWLALSRYFDPTCNSPKLFISKYLEDAIWNDALRGGLRTLQGDIAKLGTFFDVVPIGGNGSFVWESAHFQLVQTIHVVDAFEFMPSFGLIITVDGMKVYITTDTQYAPKQLKDFYAMSDVIFHDCETLSFLTGVHANYQELVHLPADVKSKMWLYHYNMGELPDATADGFKGFVNRGVVFDF